MAFAAPLTSEARLGGWGVGSHHPWDRTWCFSSWPWSWEHILGLLGMAVLSLWGWRLGKAFTGLSLTGPPAGVQHSVFS